jgi:molecular chaperone IbpA
VAPLAGLASANPMIAGAQQQHVASEGGYVMRGFDLTPLYRSTVGFDRMFSLLDSAFDGPAQSYPPYNIERTGEDAYRITVAVAGFTDKELHIEVKESALTIRGEKTVNEQEDKPEVLYQGIAARAFERRFQLADHVEVTGASVEHGLLHVDLVRRIPEAKKPRQIPIGNANGKAQVIDAKAA